MRKCVLFLAAVMMVIGANAMAQVDPDVNSIGVYFDTGATVHCLPPVVAPGSHGPGFIYLIITNPSAGGGVFGWECSIEVCPTMFVLNWGYVGQAINACTEPDFLVGLATALPWAPAVVLLDMTIFLTAMDCCWIYIHPSATPSIPGYPAYVDGGDVGNIISLGQSTGGDLDPVAGINCICPPPIGSQDQTWGTVKALYR